MDEDTILEQPAAETAVPETPAVDVEAIRAQARAEARDEYERELALRSTPAPQTATPAQEAVPDRYGDPDGYDRYFAQKIARETKDSIMGEIAPLLGRVQADTVTRDLSYEGMGSEGRKLIETVAPGLSAAALNDPKAKVLRDMIQDAGRYRDQKAAPARLNPEPAHTPVNSGSYISPEERRMAGIGQPGGISEARFLELRRAEGGTILE